MLEHGIGDETGAAGVDMSVAAASLVRDMEALGMTISRWSRARVIATYRRRSSSICSGAAGGEVGRNAAVDRIQQAYRAPFLALAEWIVEG